MKRVIVLLTIVCSAAIIHAKALGGSNAEKRVLDPVKPVPAEKPAEAAPAAEKVEASSNDSIEIGVIDTVALSGSVEFAVEQGAYRAIKEALCDGKVKTIGDLKAVFAKVRNDLLRKGYYLAMVGPDGNAYNAETRQLLVVVDSGKFGDIGVQMDEDSGKWYSEDNVKKRIETIGKEEPFNYKRLRKALAGINGHPDLVADTKLSVRSARNGEAIDSRLTRYADIDLTVRDSFPLHFVWDINNYGMEEIDDWQTSFTVQYLNLTGADDVLTVSPAVSFNRDLWSVAVGYMRPFELLNGGNWTLYGGYNDLDTDKILPQLDLDGSGWFVGLNSSWNIMDDENKNLAFFGGILYRKMEDCYTVKGAALNIRDRELGILPLTFGISYGDKKRDALGGRNFASASVSFNTATDGDPVHDFYDKAEQHYYVGRAEIARLQSLFADAVLDGEEWKAWSMFGRVSGQYSPDVLIPAEKISIGGMNTVRGYRMRGYMGDCGVYGTLELRTPVVADAIAGLFRDSTGKTALDRMQFFAFGDMGYTRYNNMTVGYADSDFLAAIGVGAKFGFTQYCQLSLDLALPLRETHQDKLDKKYDEDFELYLSLRFQY